MMKNSHFKNLLKNIDNHVFGIPTEKRSRKAQEARANSLLKLSDTLVAAFAVAILIVPITAIVQSGFSPSAFQLSIPSKEWTIVILIKLIIFVACEYGILYLSSMSRARALDILDTLYPDELHDKQDQNI